MHVRWGVIGAARIAVEHTIPAIQRSDLGAVVAIASRHQEKARQVADRFHLPKAYGAYEALLEDPAIDAVYIPLANHLHVPWSIAALDAGKHVLCEKPIGLSAAEAQRLAQAAERRPRQKLMEAFMYRFHPQWVTAKRLVDEGRLGEVRAIQTFFSYYDRDPQSICNRREVGGGALLDIGCYGVSLSRFLLGAAPRRVLARVEFDPEFAVDRLVTAVLDFEHGQSSFVVGTQLAPFQRVDIVGTAGRVQIEIPFNAPSDRPCRLRLQSADEAYDIAVPAANQYAIQADLFARAILDDAPPPTPIDDALANMRVIDALFRSGRSNGWEQVR